jgi:cobalt-zinc-cadmium efflux system membrane fusion protein
MVRIAIAQAAEVELTALNSRVSAKVESVSPRLDPESRRAAVFLTLAQPVAGLKAGMLANVTLQVSSDSSITVPTSAVLIKGGKRHIVYVEREDGTFEAREVQTARNQGGRVAILTGLKPGEKVVTKGALLLDTQAELLL